MDDLVTSGGLQDLNLECITLKEILEITYDLTTACYIDILKKSEESNKMLPPSNFDDQVIKNAGVSTDNNDTLKKTDEPTKMLPAFNFEDQVRQLLGLSSESSKKADVLDKSTFSEDDSLSCHSKDDLVEVTKNQSSDDASSTGKSSRRGVYYSNGSQTEGAACLPSSPSIDEGVQIALLLEDEYGSAHGSDGHNTLLSSIKDISNCISSSGDKSSFAPDMKSSQSQNYPGGCPTNTYCYQGAIPNPNHNSSDCGNTSSWQNCEPSAGCPKIRNSKSHGTARHANSKRYTCPYCDYGTIYSRNLKLHVMAKHTNDKPLPCPQCDTTTSGGEHIKFHTVTKHSKDKSPAACPHCENCAVTTGTLKLHIKHKHLTEVPTLSCQCCDFRNSHSGLLKQHFIGKHNDRHTFCPYCEFRAVETELRKRHANCKHT